MRELERIDRILNLIRVIWIKSPDQRLLQLLINNGVINDGNDWYLEDDDLENHLLKLTKKSKEVKNGSK